MNCDPLGRLVEEAKLDKTELAEDEPENVLGTEEIWEEVCWLVATFDDGMFAEEETDDVADTRVA